jgi:UDP-N-acetylglucosamine 4,6-dehydratase
MAMNGGEIFVPKLPSMKISDLAEAIAPNSERVVVGMRPAEKLHEVLITEEESRHTQEFENYYVIEPEFPFWRDKTKLVGKKLPEGFQYTSGNNGRVLSISELEGLIADG